MSDSNIAAAYERAFATRDSRARDEIRALRTLVAALLLSSPSHEIRVPDDVAAACLGEGLKDYYVKQRRDHATATTVYYVGPHVPGDTPGE